MYGGPVLRYHICITHDPCGAEDNVKWKINLYLLLLYVDLLSALPSIMLEELFNTLKTCEVEMQVSTSRSRLRRHDFQKYFFGVSQEGVLWWNTFCPLGRT